MHLIVTECLQRLLPIGRPEIAEARSQRTTTIIFHFTLGAPVIIRVGNPTELDKDAHSNFAGMFYVCLKDVRSGREESFRLGVP
jgi:hypothetical protein